MAEVMGKTPIPTTLACLEWQEHFIQNWVIKDGCEIEQKAFNLCGLADMFW